MPTPNPNAQQALCAEILAEARRQSDQAIRSAQQEAEGLLAKARGEASKIGQERLARARAEAARRQKLIQATVPVEIARLRAARIEVLMQSIFEEVRRQLLARSGFDYREAIIGLAAEAIRRMEGDSFVVKLSATDRGALGEGLPEEIVRRLGRAAQLSITDGPAVGEGGVIVQDTEGHQLWDNRPTARLERLWPELRRQIAQSALLFSESSPTGGSA